MKSNELERAHLAPLQEALPLLVQEHLHDLTVLQQRAEHLGERVAQLKQWLTQQAQQLSHPDMPGDVSLPALAVLVVSEHATIRLLLLDLITELGCRAVAVRAIELADETLPCDVLLIDDVWPLDHTLALLRDWRGAHPDVAVVVGAALPEGPVRERLRGAGVAEFAAKPYTPDDLARCLRSAVASKV